MMNERIKEFEKQAFDAVWDVENDSIGPGTHFRPDGFEQKFAELIVKECANFTDPVTRNLMFKHFGIEK